MTYSTVERSPQPVRVFCDFDGILTTSPVGGGPLVADSIIAAFAEIARRPGVDFWWLSSNRHALTIAGGLDLPTRSVSARRDWPAETHTHRVGHDWWKLHVLRATLLLAPAPFVWIDDLIDEVPAARAWLRCVRVPSLAIAPPGGLGLRRADLASIGGFVERYAPQPAGLVT